MRDSTLNGIHLSDTYQYGEPVPPTKPVFVLDNGMRVGFDVKYVEWRPHFGFVFRPIIEGELREFMPHIIGVDADVWPTNTALNLPPAPDGINNDEWVARILANSPCLKRSMTRSGYREKENENEH